MYACISLGRFLPPERRIIFGYTALNMFVCVTIVFGTLAGISEESYKFLEEFKRKFSRQFIGDKRKRKLIRSYFPLRISVGEANFVETSTPLVCQQMIIEQTVNLALLH